MMTRLLPVALLCIVPTAGLAAVTQLTIKASNPIAVSRSSETIELPAQDLAPLGRELSRIRVRDAAGRELLCQAVDSDGDHVLDQVLFQSNFAPSEEKTFTAVLGAPWEYTRDQFKAYGRFVRERFDDFTWENDRIAHRTYGKALETWKNEPLTSSTIDIWSKRTADLVINDWYLTDNYHVDHGKGADFYSAGLSRGCGGNGLWAADQLWVSRNFVESRVLANGPIRVLFELSYEPFNVNGISVSEVKRVSLDAGQSLDRIQSSYHPLIRPGQSVNLVMAAGLKKVAGEQPEFNADRGWLVKWERMEKDAGEQGLALIVPPQRLERQAEDRLNLLLLARVPETRVAPYRAGFCWDKAGHYPNSAAWRKYVDEVAQGEVAPIKITVTTD